MKFTRLVSLTVAACLTMGCAHPMQRTVVKPVVPATEADCIAKGGKWGPLGISGTLRCDLKTTDAGNSCKDSLECEGSCIAPPDTAAGVRVAGSCSAYVANFGDVIFVSDGKADPYNVE